MLSRDEARSRVLAELERGCGLGSGPQELVIIDEATLERPWGWVFFYNTRGARDGDILQSLAGNAPFIVNRFDGTLRATGTAYAIEHYIEEYEAELERQQGAWELVIQESPDSPLEVFSRLRDALGLSVTQIGALRKTLPCVYRSGARVDLAPILARLTGANIAAELRRAAHAQ
jgi:hypothetical protein